MHRTPFQSREDAGRQLGVYLLQNKVQGEVVLGLPRGGVVVAAEVAATLRRPLDVLVVRKVGHPSNPEFAIGALAESEVLVLDSDSHSFSDSLEQTLENEKRRLASFTAKFHPAGLRLFRDQTVILVDDGLATGASMEAAVISAKKGGAARVIVAVPVASKSGVQRIERWADSVFSLIIDPDFVAVGRYIGHLNRLRMNTY